MIILHDSMNYVEKCRFSPISNPLLKLFIALLNYPLTVTDIWAEMAEEKAKLVFFPPIRRQTIIDISKAINMWKPL